MIKKLLGVGIILLVAGTLLPVIWPLMVGTDTAVQALTETDSATTTLQTFWPVVLLVGGIGIAAGAIFFVLRRVGVMK